MPAILLADDDVATLDLVRRALESDGHKVVTTQDGTEALEAITGAAPPDLLISDINMPGLDGITLAEKAVAAHPKLRILLMSGFSAELDRAKSIKASRLDILTKPFTLDQMRASVKALLSQ